MDHHGVCRHNNYYAMFSFVFLLRSCGLEGYDVTAQMQPRKLCMPMAKRSQSALPLCCTIGVTVTRLLSPDSRSIEVHQHLTDSRSHAPSPCHILVVCCLLNIIMTENSEASGNWSESHTSFKLISKDLETVVWQGILSSK